MTWTRPRRDGFSLIELLLVLVLLGVLLLVALPAYQQQLLQGRRILAVAALQQLHLRQTQYFVHHRRYAPSLSELGFAADELAVDTGGELVAGAGPSRLYRIRLADASEQAYQLLATPLGAQARDRECRLLGLDQSGRREAMPGSVQRCW